MTRRHFHAEQWFPKAAAEIFEFFSDARNLQAITPPWLHFEFVTPTPIDMRPGTLIDYRLRLHGIPVRWQTEITEWHPPRLFVDVQRRGPYRHWIHTHRFEAKDDGTLVVDDIDYAVPGWLLEPLVHRFFVRPDLDKVFAYRAERLSELLGVPQGST